MCCQPSLYPNQGIFFFIFRFPFLWAGTSLYCVLHTIDLDWNNQFVASPCPSTVHIHVHIGMSRAMKHSFSHYITGKFSKSALIIASPANPPPFPPPPPPSSVSRFLRCTLWPQCSFAKRALSPSSSSFFWHSTHRILAQKRPASRCTNIRFGPKKAKHFFTQLYIWRIRCDIHFASCVCLLQGETQKPRLDASHPHGRHRRKVSSLPTSLFPSSLFSKKNVPFFLPSLSFPADCALPCYNTP